MTDPGQYRLEQFIQTLNKGIRPIENGLAILAGVIIIALTFVITFDVISRAFFNAPIQNSYEFMALGLVPIVYFGLAKVQANGENIFIESATSWLPIRAQSFLDLCGCLVGLFTMGAIAYWGALATLHDFKSGDYAGSVSQVLIWPFRATLVVGSVALMLRLVIDVLRHVSAIITPTVNNPDPREEWRPTAPGPQNQERNHAG